MSDLEINLIAQAQLGAALLDYDVFAARPGVLLEPSLVNFLVQVTQGTGSCARKVQLAGQGQLIPASTEPNFAVHV